MEATNNQLMRKLDAVLREVNKARSAADEALDYDGCARLTKLPRALLKKLVASKRIPFTMIDGRVVFLHSSVMRWLAAEETVDDATLDYTAAAFVRRHIPN